MFLKEYQHGAVNYTRDPLCFEYAFSCIGVWHDLMILDNTYITSYINVRAMRRKSNDFLEVFLP